MNEFRTTDMGFAAYLQTNGIILTNAPKERGKTTFVFDLHPDDADHYKASWMNGLGTVSARDYHNNLKMLKSMVHNF